VLLLFDIDGTLVLNGSREHREAIHEAIHELWGVPDPASVHVDAAGRTDVEIARRILLLSGVDAKRIDRCLPDFRAAAAAAFARRVPDDLSDHLAPGAHEVLSALAGREGTILSLVTGNLEPIARRKLLAAGIGQHFPPGQGAFGSDSEDRSELPAIARARAGRRDGRPWPPRQTVVIGDTPRDIACARADDARCIAVATGPYPADQLRGADAVIGTLRELPDVLARISGRAGARART
jgi:phosphoglycolate phosphatase-like HAD superfamily hydrolase